MIGLSVRQRLAALVLLIFLALGGVLIFINDSRRGVEFPVTSETKPLYVHICGAVAKPGIVKLHPGTRVFAALKQAGGALPGADLNQVNLAKFVEDGEQIYIPVKGEVVSSSTAKDGRKPKSSKRATEKWNGPLDLNTATARQLETVPGIGPALAGRIVDYRTEHGRFQTYDELDKVSGIGISTLEKFRAFLYVK